MTGGSSFLKEYFKQNWMFILHVTYVLHDVSDLIFLSLPFNIIFFNISNNSNQHFPVNFPFLLCILLRTQHIGYKYSDDIFMSDYYEFKVKVSTFVDISDKTWEKKCANSCFWLFVCLWLYVPLENVSGIWRVPQYRWLALNFNQ